MILRWYVLPQGEGFKVLREAKPHGQHQERQRALDVYGGQRRSGDPTAGDCAARTTGKAGRRALVISPSRT